MSALKSFFYKLFEDTTFVWCYMIAVLLILGTPEGKTLGGLAFIATSLVLAIVMLVKGVMWVIKKHQPPPKWLSLVHYFKGGQIRLERHQLALLGFLLVFTMVALWASGNPLGEWIAGRMGMLLIVLTVLICLAIEREQVHDHKPWRITGR